MQSIKKLDRLIVFTISISILSIIVNAIVGTILNISLIIIEILVLLYEIKKYGLTIEKREKSIFSIILIVIGCTLIVSILGINLEKSLKTTVLLGGKVILLFFIVILDRNRLKNFKSFIKIFNVFVVFCVLYACIIKFFGNIPQPYVSENGMSIYKQSLYIGGIQLSQYTMGKNINNHSVSSITGNPNSFSYLCAYAIAINITLIQLNKFEKKKYRKYILSILISFCGLLMGGSRTAILMTLIYGGIYDFLIIKSKGESYIKRRQIFIVLGTLIGVTTILYFWIKPQLIINLLDLNGREEVWKIFFDTFKENPLFIAGIGNTIEVISKNLGFELSLHNTYFTCIMELGLIFGSLFIILQFAYIISSIRKIKKCESKEEKELFVLMIGICILFLIQACTEVIIITNNFESLFYYYLLFMQVILRSREKNEG